MLRDFNNMIVCSFNSPSLSNNLANYYTFNNLKLQLSLQIKGKQEKKTHFYDNENKQNDSGPEPTKQLTCHIFIFFLDCMHMNR